MKKYTLSHTRTRSDFLGNQVAWDITDEHGNGFFISWRCFTSSFAPDCRNPECMAFPLAAKGPCSTRRLPRSTDSTPMNRLRG
jgi:hypothetical protein